jgi:hypothetical protein
LFPGSTPGSPGSPGTSSEIFTSTVSSAVPFLSPNVAVTVALPPTRPTEANTPALEISPSE